MINDYKIIINGVLLLRIRFQQNIVVCHMLPCSPVGIHRPFKETNELHFQSRRISQASDQQEFLLSYALDHATTVISKGVMAWFRFQ
jgi:hypothetical protein